MGRGRFKNKRLYFACLCVALGTWAVLSFSMSMFIAPKKAQATHCTPISCACTFSAHATTQIHISSEHSNTQQEFGFSGGASGPGTGRLGQHEEWLIETFFLPRIRPALMMMTEQLTSVMMSQLMMIGSFLDAKQQLETQLLFQRLTARAHKDYHPSFGMCVFGTNVRSLAAAEFKGEIGRIALSERFIDRQLGNRSSVGGLGPIEDKYNQRASQPPKNRIHYFLENTCDERDLNYEPANAVPTGLMICATNPVRGWAQRDIDFTNTIMGPRTINADFVDPQVGADNARVFEMANYLYGNTVFTRPDSSLLLPQKNKDEFMDTRSVIAKRSVAQNSFNAIVGLKSHGTRDSDPAPYASGGRQTSSEQSKDYMYVIASQLLGIPVSDQDTINKYLSQKDSAVDSPGSPDNDRDEMSYYAQLEFLAKKLYQRPEFYTELYDKPANVKRKSAAMQAIGMMIEREVFDSQLRSEALMSMILELKVYDEQQSVENQFGMLSTK